VLKGKDNLGITLILRHFNRFNQWLGDGCWADWTGMGNLGKEFLLNWPGYIVWLARSYLEARYSIQLDRGLVVAGSNSPYNYNNARGKRETLSQLG